MPIFFFDVDDGDEHTRDKLGVELADLAAARREATLLAGELLRDRPDDLWDSQAWKMTVEDEHGRHLFAIDIAATAAPVVMQQLKSQRDGGGD